MEKWTYEIIFLASYALLLLIQGKCFIMFSKKSENCTLTT